MPLGLRRRSRCWSTARGDDLVDVDRARLVQRVVALQPGQLDDLLHQPGQPVALGLHPAGEAAAPPRGRRRPPATASASRLERADRGLQLVADVGDEVAADRLDPALAGAVLDQRQHQPAAQRGDPGGDVRAARPRGRGHRPARSRGSARRGVPAGPGRRARATASRVARARARSAYAGAEALSTSSLSSTTRALERSTREHGGDARRARRAPRRPRARASARSLTRQARTTPPPSTAPSSANRSACVVRSTPRSYARRHRSFASTGP